MKLNKTMGRVATTLVATAMLASVAVVPAFAADNTGVIGDEVLDSEGKTAITEVNVGKMITTDGKTYCPAGTYYIKVEEGEGGTINDGTQELTALPGQAGAVEVDTYPASTVGGTLTDGHLPTSFEASTDGKLSIDASVFTAPGVYHYEVTEIDPNTDDDESTIPVEGMTYDDNKFDMYLYVMVNDDYDAEDPDSNPYYVGYVVTIDPDNNAEGVIRGKSDLEFMNDYGTQEEPKLHDVTILKKVDGDQGDTNKLFKFNVQVNGENNEKFVIEYKASNKTEDAVQYITVTTGDTLEQSPIEISSTGYIKIYSLDATDKYTVTELEATDYTTNIDTDYIDGEDIDDAEKTNVKTTGELTMGNDDNTVVFYNTKNSVTPTGIVMNVAPYALLVVVAAAGCFVFMRKRRED